MRDIDNKLKQQRGYVLKKYNLFFYLILDYFKFLKSIKFKDIPCC